MRVILVALLFALAGCTDDADPPAEPSAPSEPTEPSAPSEPADPGPPANETPLRDPVTWEVEVQDNRFSPAELTIQIGDTVKWVRIGNAPHTVTADNGEFDSGDCPGLDCFSPAGMQEYEWTAEVGGDVPYACEVHASMTGSISVVERHDATPA